jgi:gp16 family phage-associated protein
MTFKPPIKETTVKKDSSGDLIKQFRISLAAAGTTQTAWARENGTSQEFVSRVLHGKRSSRKYSSKIALFIHEQMTRLKQTNHSL